MQIVLYSDDINLLIHWEKCIEDNYLSVEDIDELLKIKNSLIVVNYTVFGSSVEYYLGRLNLNNNRVLILHRVPDIQTAKQILSLGAMGYGNAMMRQHYLISAIETIKDNMVWLYPEFTTMLIMEIPSKGTKEDTVSLISALSSREKDVALLLKDGDTYKEIAEKLNITPRTVKAHASHIYEKLQVKDKIALALLLK
jgi:DNA-binding NarL/FixJ family response regulator